MKTYNVRFGLITWYHPGKQQGEFSIQNVVGKVPFNLDSCCVMRAARKRVEFGLNKIHPGIVPQEGTHVAVRLQFRKNRIEGRTGVNRVIWIATVIAWNTQLAFQKAQRALDFRNAHLRKSVKSASRNGYQHRSQKSRTHFAA